MHVLFTMLVALGAAIVGAAVGYYLTKHEVKIRERKLESNVRCLLRCITDENITKLEQISRASSGQLGDSVLITGFEVTIYKTALPVLTKENFSPDLVSRVAKCYSLLCDYQQWYYRVLELTLNRNTHPAVAGLESMGGQYRQVVRTALLRLREAI